MRIDFDDKSYIACEKSNNPGKIIVTISALDANNSRKKITNAVELTMEEFQRLISDVT